MHGVTEDKGTNDTWASKQLIGGWNDVASTNVSYSASGLEGGSQYYYTFRATNVTDGAVWATPSWSVRTPGTAPSTASTFMFW